MIKTFSNLVLRPFVFFLFLYLGLIPVVRADYVYEGVIVRADGSSISSSVDLKFQIRGDGGSTCVLYEEALNGVLLQSNGFVSAKFMTDTSVRTAADPGLSSDSIFSNSTPLVGSGGCSFVPSSSSSRNLFVTVTAGATSEEFGPMALVEVPRATVAKRLDGISGAALSALLSGNSNLYVKAGSAGAAALPKDPGTPASLPEGSIWFDSATDQVKFHNGTSVVTLGTGGGGGITSVVSGGAPLVVSNGSTTPSISMPAASSGQDGFLTSADWAAFNSKQPAGSYLTSIAYADVISALTFTPMNMANGVQKGGNSGAFSLGTTDPHPFTVLTNNTPRIRVESGGNVGIGTTSPQADLDVFLSATDLLLTNARGIRLFNNSAQDQNFNNIKFSSIDSTGTNQRDGGILGVQYMSHNNGSFTGDMFFMTNQGSGAPSEKMRIKGDGKVGIGTANPGAALEINGQIKITGGAPGAGKVLQSDANGLATWATLGGSESTSVSNIGTAGTGLFKQMAGANIELKKINAASTAITITDDTPNNELDIGVNTELGGLAGLASVGFVKRAGAGSYSTSTIDLTSDVSNILPISMGGTGASSVASARNTLSPLTSKGDIFVHNGTLSTSLSVGGNNQFLVANNGAATGLEWRGIAAADLPTTLGNNMILTTSGTGVIQGTPCSLNEVLSFNVSGFPVCSDVSSIFPNGLKQNGNSLGGDMIIGTNDAFPIRLETGGINRMSILSDGKVGIGNVAPAYELDVTGHIRSESAKLKQVHFQDNDGSNFATLRAPTNITTNYTLDLPPEPGAVNEILKLTAVGVLGWAKMKVDDVVGIRSNAGDLVFYVRSDGHDDCDGRVNSSGGPNPTVSCAVASLDGALRRLPIVIRDPVVLNISSNITESTKTAVFNKIFEGNGTLTVNGGGYTYYANTLTTGPAFLFQSRGVNPSGPRTIINQLQVQPHSDGTAFMVMGDVRLNSINVTAASRPISLDDGYLMFTGINNISVATSSSSVGLGLGNGTLEVGDGSGGADTLVVNLPAPSTSQSLKGVTCYACNLRIRGDGDLRVEMNGSGTGFAVGLQIGNGASVEVEASGVSGFTVDNNSSSSGIGLESDGGKIYVFSGKLWFEMFGGEGIKLNSGANIHVESAGDFKVHSGSTAVGLHMGSALYSRGMADIYSTNISVPNIELSGGSLLQVDIPSGRTFNLAKASSSGVGIRAFSGSQVRFNKTGGAFTVSNVNPLFDVKRSSELNLSGSGYSGVSSLQIERDLNSMFLNGTADTFSAQILSRECPNGFQPSGPANNKICRKSSNNGNLDYAAAVSACGAGSHLCSRREMRLICQELGSGTFRVEDMIDAANAFTINCSGGTMGSAGTAATLDSYCCLD